MLSSESVREFFSYNDMTGTLTWRNPNKNSRGIEGRDVSSISSNGYICVTINNIKYLAHRIIWLYVTGYMPDEFIDHINCIKTDNRFCNLRIATRSENGMNRKKNEKNISGHKNVYPNKGGYLVQIKSNKKTYRKWFKDIESAVLGAKNIRSQHHGKFKNNGDS